MKDNGKITLSIGDQIGFVIMANNLDENDRIIYGTVVEITTRDTERAYFYQMPDGYVSRAAIRQSDLVSHVIRIQSREAGELICLNERQKEFTEAIQRADDDDLKVFPAWERDAFIVVNHSNRTEYKVTLKTVEGKVFASCECSDFRYRNRVCKHQAEVLRDAFSIPQPIEQRGLHKSEPLRNLMTRFSGSAAGR